MTDEILDNALLGEMAGVEFVQPFSLSTLIGEFAEDLTELLPTEDWSSLVRRAEMLARGAQEHTAAMIERLEFYEGLVASHRYAIEQARGQAAREVARSVVTSGMSGRFDPRGDFVYILWGEDGHPVYIGESTNVISRVGAHMDDSEKRAATHRVQLIRCAGAMERRDMEKLLIEAYRPKFNIQYSAR